MPYGQLLALHKFRDQTNKSCLRPPFPGAVTTVFHGVSVPVGSQLLFLVDRLIDTLGYVWISTEVQTVEVVFFVQPMCFINIVSGLDATSITNWVLFSYLDNLDYLGI
jgi:hypothetical protein